MALRLLRLALLLLLAGTGPAHTARLTLEAVNNAEFSPGKSKGLNPTIVKAQVLLDRARFSPGVIDGAGGDNFMKAVSAFQQRQQLEATGRLDAQTWEKLNANASEPALIEYTLKAGDVKGPSLRRYPGNWKKWHG